MAYVDLAHDVQYVSVSDVSYIRRGGGRGLGGIGVSEGSEMRGKAGMRVFYGCSVVLVNRFIGLIQWTQDPKAYRTDVVVRER